MNGQQVIVIPLQDAGVKGGQVGLLAYILGVDVGGGKVAAEDKIGLVNFRATVAAGKNATISHHGTHAVVLIEDGRGVGKQGFEVVTDGENILVAGVVKVHQLANTHAVLRKGKVVGNVDVVEDIFPEKKKDVKKKSKTNHSDYIPFFIYRMLQAHTYIHTCIHIYVYTYIPYNKYAKLDTQTIHLLVLNVGWTTQANRRQNEEEGCFMLSDFQTRKYSSFTKKTSRIQLGVKSFTSDDKKLSC